MAHDLSLRVSATTHRERRRWLDPTSRTGRIIAGLLAVAAGLTAFLVADSAQATSTHADPARPPAGSQQVWTDYHGTGHLTNGIVSLIGQAASGATINFKTYYFHDDGHLAHRVVVALHRAHKRHIDVNVMVQRQGMYTTKQWKAFRKDLSFADVSWCQWACTADPAVPSIAHSKFMTISNLAGAHSSVVLETSTNISQQQLGRTVQSAVVFRDNSSAYAAFAHEFARYVACIKGDCIAASAPVTQAITPKTGVIFAPFTGRGPWTTELKATTAAPGCYVYLMSINVHDDALAHALVRLQTEGCKVRVMVEHRGDFLGVDDGLSDLTPKGGRTHDKVLLIHNGARDVVYAGSLDFTTGAAHLNNQQMIVSTDPATVAAYHSWVAKVWNSKSMTIWPAPPPTG